MENGIAIPKPTTGFLQNVKNFYSKYGVILFACLSILYLLGSFFRISNHFGCSDEISAYFFQYLIVVLPPFLIVYFLMLLEAGRNRLLGKESTQGFIYSLHAFVFSIFSLGVLVINYMAFFSDPSCGKFGDDYSWIVLLIGACFCYVYAAYLVIMLLTWIIRAVRAR